MKNKKITKGWLKIKEIIYIEKGLINNKFILNIEEKLANYNNTKRQLTNEEIEKIIYKLYRIIGYWKKGYYINSNTLDKPNWCLKIIYDNNEEKTYSGNIYPNNYNNLLFLLESVINNEFN